MKRIKLLIVLAVLLGQAVALPADIQRQVFQLLSSLSQQYREARAETPFRETVALLPFAEESAEIRKYELAAVVESLVVREMSRSTYFVLVERKELERLLEEVELSLSDLAAGPPPAAGLGELAPASLLLAGGIAEAGRELVVSARLIDTAAGTVLAAESVSVPREELIEEARTGAYSYVARHGLGFQVEGGILFHLAGVPRINELKDYPAMAHLAAGVSYRPAAWLQLRAGMHTAWTELQMGTFDPESAEYDNSGLLTTYFANNGSGEPKYGFECSQSYLQAEAAFVFSPGRRVALSVGGGGIFGLWSAMVKLSDLPVYIGDYLDDGTPADPTILANYVTRSVILRSSNSLLLGLTASLRAELFLSPRLLVFACAHVQQLFASEPFYYTYGGSRAETKDDAGFVELSGWQPNLTPWGDELGFDTLSAGLALGLSFAF
jgi:TolB-like protein